jgi:chromosome segregation ATPase
MEIEELSNNIQRVLGMLHQIHAENDALKCELAKSGEIMNALRAENEGLKCEIDKLHDILRRQEQDLRTVAIPYSDKPERMERILPYNEKPRSITPPIRGGGGGKKTSL